jgi:hypothetical protein
MKLTFFMNSIYSFKNNVGFSNINWDTFLGKVFLYKKFIPLLFGLYEFHNYIYGNCYALTYSKICLL